MIQFDTGHITLALVCVGLVIQGIIDRKKYWSNMESLLKATLAKTPLEYQQSLKTSAEQTLEDRATSKLAEHALNLEKIKTPENLREKVGERNFPVGA